MTLRRSLVNKASNDLDDLERTALGALTDTEQTTGIEADVKALRLAVQQWEAFVRALQQDGRPAIYAVPNVLGEDDRARHQRVCTLVSRLEAVHGVTQASAQ